MSSRAVRAAYTAGLPEKWAAIRGAVRNLGTPRLGRRPRGGGPPLSSNPDHGRSMTLPPRPVVVGHRLGHLGQRVDAAVSGQLALRQLHQLPIRRPRVSAAISPLTREPQKLTVMCFMINSPEDMESGWPVAVPKRSTHRPCPAVRPVAAQFATDGSMAEIAPSLPINSRALLCQSASSVERTCSAPCRASLRRRLRGGRGSAG